MIKIIFKKLNYFFLFLLLTSLLASCNTSRKINYLQKPSASIPSYKDNIGYEEYVIAPTDKLFIKVYSLDENINKIFNGNVQNMNIATGSGAGDYTELYTYTVKDDGTIRLPMLGDVHVAGQNIRNVKKIIEDEVKTVTIDKCAVDIKTVGRYFSVIGGNINGKYPIFREKMNIFQAVAMAGDINIYGDRSQIKLLRETPNGIPVVKTFDIRSKDIINSEYYYIQPNDVIYIQDIKSQFFSVSTVGSAFSTLFSTVSFGLLIYNLTAPKKETTTQPKQ